MPTADRYPGHGFHVNYSAPPLNAVQSGPAILLATAMRNAMVADGMQPVHLHRF